MPWGDENVTKILYKQDSTTSWGPIGSPKSVQLQKQGILKSLRMIQTTTAFTPASGATASAMGPFNAYTQLELLANSQQDIFRFSGIGGYYVSIVKHALEKNGIANNAALPSPVNVTDTDYVFDGRATTAPTNNTTGWNWYLNLPVSQYINGVGELGLIPMQTENAQLLFNFTPNARSVSGTTYTIDNNSASDDLSQAYVGTGGTTIGAPAVDLVRTLYEPVSNPQDLPNFSFISQWLEETPTTFSGTGFTWKQSQDAGTICRIIFAMYQSTSPWGVPSSTLTASNALQLSYNNDIVKFKETGLEALARQRDDLGGDLPYGVFEYDLLGPNLTMTDTLNSYIVPNIQLQMTTTSVTLNTNINPKVLIQRLLPLRVA